MNSEQRKALHEEMILHAVVSSCLNCEQFDKEKCQLAPTYNLPAKVVVYGCPKWTMMIPF